MLCTSSLASAWCYVEKTIEHEFEASDFESLNLNALAGELNVRGSSTDKIVFTGRACTDEQQYLDRMKLDIDKAGSNLILTVIIPYADSDFDANYAHMDIDLTLPADLSIALKDSSGHIRVDDAHLVLIDDSSGDITVRDSTGNLELKDSSGEIDINDHRGNIMLTDSSGDIELSRIHGNVFIPGDSSGEIDIDSVEGFVKIDNDSSGSIEIEEVGADVTIGNDGSGDIDLSDIEGSIVVENDGSGRVKVTQVTGDFTLLSKGSGDVKTHDVRGQVSLPRNKRD